MFYQVITPLIGVVNTAVLAITTPQAGRNYFNELMELRGADGKRLFDVLQLGMVCQACAATGARCTHKLHMNPHWRSYERVAKVDAIMESNPELRDQETRGMLMEVPTNVLNKKMVERFFKRKRFHFPDETPTTVGLDFYEGTNPRKVDEMILRHCVMIRDHPRYKNAMVVFYIELNLSKIDANRIWNTIRRVPRFADRRYVVRTEHLGCAGRLTTHRSKEEWVDELRTHIGTLSMVEDHEFITNPARPASEIQAKLRDQLINFRRDVVPDNKDPALRRGPARVNITGKDRGKRDDLVSALAFNLLNMDLDLVRRPDRNLLARIAATGRSASC